jgi:hypothetical protein
MSGVIERMHATRRSQCADRIDSGIDRSSGTRGARRVDAGIYEQGACP